MLRVLAAVLALMAASYAAGLSVLHEHGRLMGQSEQAGLARHHLARVESLLDQAVGALRGLEKTGRLGCRETDRAAFADVAATLPFVMRIVVVAADGNPLCAEPTGKQALWPARRADDDEPLQFLLDEAVPPDAQGSRRLLVSWKAGEVRLVAEMTAAAFAVEGGAEFLRRVRSAEVLLAGHRLWSERGPADADLSVASAASAIYPLQVTVAVPTAALDRLAEPLAALLLAAIVCGGATVAFYVVSLHWRSRQGRGELASAVKRGEFVPYYQPVVNILNGRLEGCEVLARWRKRDGTIVPPGQFMQEAEATGEAFEITRQLMAKVASELESLLSAHPELKVSLNLFAGHFDDSRIVEDVRRIFGDRSFEFRQLVFEITERMPLRNVDAARSIMEELKSLGCRIALDDAGCGHSGLATIQQLPFDIIKIDKMFVDSIDVHENSSCIVDVLVGLAGSFRLGLIAEGVEREEQVMRLRALGITVAQGYFFAPPLPGRAFLDLAAALLPARDAGARADGPGAKEGVVAA